MYKNWKRPSFYLLTETRFFYIFINNSRSNQIKKNPEQLLVDIVKQEMCANFLLKILNSVVVGAHQSFQFFRQIT